MKRRLFAKMLALGAGGLPLLPLDDREIVAEETGSDSTIAAGEDAKKVTQADNPTLPGTAAADANNVPAVNVDDFTALAKAKLPKATFEYITTGSEDEVTLKDNVAAFRRIRVLTPLLKGVAACDLSTTVLKQRISMPVLLAPVAAQRMYHPQGALAAARAATAAGTIYGVSTSVGNSVEEVAAATKGPLWFQLYVPKSRDVTRRLVQRVEKADYKAIIVTVDLGERKDSDRRNNFTVPKDMLLKHLRDVGHTQLNDKMSYEEILAFNSQAWEMALSWDFFEWLRSVTKLPLLVKGVLTIQDARKAVSLGLDGIVVSNHGGRRLDGVPASIDVLPEIAADVGDKIEVLMDGGIRRGGDVMKAIALGAKAVLIGRPYAWALAADGEDGVRQVLQMLHDELTNAMLATGCAKIDDIDQSLIVS